MGFSNSIARSTKTRIETDKRMSAIEAAKDSIARSTKTRIETKDVFRRGRGIK